MNRLLLIALFFCAGKLPAPAQTVTEKELNDYRAYIWAQLQQCSQAVNDWEKTLYRKTEQEAKQAHENLKDVTKIRLQRLTYMQVVPNDPGFRNEAMKLIKYLNEDGSTDDITYTLYKPYLMDATKERLFESLKNYKSTAADYESKIKLKENQMITLLLYK